MTARHLALSACTALSMIAGCFNPTFKNTIACGANDACPPGTSCGTDGLCHAPGTSGPGTSDAVDAPTGPPFETIKSGLHLPFYVVSGDDGFVYFTVQGEFMQNNGTVERALKTGGGGGPIATGRPDPTRLILAGDHVYWQDAREPGTLAAGLDGASVGTAQIDSLDLASDGTDVYIASNDGVFKVAVGTVAPVVTVVPRGTNPTPLSVLADASAVYWAEVVVVDDKFAGSIVKKRNKATGAITTLAPSSPYLERIVMDASYIYGAVPTRAAAGNPDDGAIVRIPLTGGGHEVMASGQDAWGLEVDAIHVYWVNHWTSDGTIKRCTKVPPCTPEVVFQDAHAMHLAQDATHLYWTSFRGVVARMAKP